MERPPSPVTGGVPPVTRPLAIEKARNNNARCMIKRAAFMTAIIMAAIIIAIMSAITLIRAHPMKAAIIMATIGFFLVAIGFLLMTISLLLVAISFFLMTIGPLVPHLIAMMACKLHTS